LIKTVMLTTLYLILPFYQKIEAVP